MAKKKRKNVAKRAKPEKKTITIAPALGKAIEKSLTIKKPDYDRRKLRLVLGNLMFFIIVFVVSTILYTISMVEFYKSLFFMLSFVFGVFSIALLIVLLIFVFLRLVNNK